EAPGALAMAQELCDQVVGLEQGQHLEGQLLRAQLFEADFDFDQAFAVYEELMRGPDFGSRPEVLVAAGSLQARLGIWDRAEDLFRSALRSERTYWGAHLALGKLLLGQDRAEEALTHLALAEQSEPRGVETKDRRLDIRIHHGWALLQLGRAQEAAEAFGRALSLDPLASGARAGLVEAARAAAPARRADAMADASRALRQGLVESNFELSLAQGLLALEQGEWVLSKRYLELAVANDPFRSYLPLGALAFLAEQTDHSDKALEYLEQSLQIQPRNAWALYTRGRILMDQGDLDQAAASLRGALELELNFPDALVSMGRLSRESGDFEAARLYLERALELEPDNAAWLTLAGFNAYSLERPDEARKYFEAALERDGSMAAAGLGEAWWHYVAKDSREAITRLGEWVEKRRNLGAEDPYVRYAEEQSARIVDHDSKEVWTDRFERRPGRIGNGWSVKEGLGPTIDLQNGAVRIEGLFTGSGRTRIYNELSADAFLSLEARIKIGPELRGCDVGLFLARERTGHGGDVVVQSEILFQRNADGKYQYRAVRRGEEDTPPIDLPIEAMPVGSEAIWTLEKVGVGSDAEIRLFVNGEPVLERLSMPTLGTATQVLRFGLFVEGQANRSVDVTLDDVRVVRRRL
ncbi:MAG TPA: tetratricopeptide repeat protein, partial [Planctomycetota bacterium]|nr:tetratricopeptide repeat protein [Planctomycetota bacterium]